ncbi:MAG TPA: M56 family metallopeptidase [Candidatus Elarobacter sp.]|jgi:beta-lactamase regulating signal transducer with metallopeptidase domain|nr:M56 family metallopeptidase [Candidatus Elarobacter sp.]
MNTVVQPLGPYQHAMLGLLTYWLLSVVVGIVAVALAAAIVRLWRPVDAAARHAVWFAALIAVALGPLVATVLIQRAHHMTAAQLRAAVAQMSRPRPPELRTVGIARPRIDVPPPLAYAAVALWLLIVLGGAGRLTAGAVVLARLKRDALPLAPERRVALPLWNAHAASARVRRARLCVSDRIDVPVAVGLFDSMVVLPRHVLEEFEPADVDRFVLHELTHLERRDDWAGLVQRIVQVLQFFNPAVHLIARQLDLEREIACDDRVVDAISDVRSYAAGLTRMAESTAWPHRGLPAPAIFVTRRQLSVRVEELLARRRRTAARTMLAPAVLAFAASLGAAAAAATLAPVVSVMYIVQDGAALDRAVFLPRAVLERMDDRTLRARVHEVFTKQRDADPRLQHRLEQALLDLQHR